MVRQIFLIRSFSGSRATERVAVFFTVALAFGCSPQLEVPSSVMLSCSDDAECPDGFRCSVDELCVAVANSVPSLSLAVDARALDRVMVSVIAFDEDADELALTAELERDEANVGAISLSESSVSASREGTTHTIEWDAAAHFGGTGYVGGLRLIITPHDGSSPGAPARTEIFGFGNDAPVVSGVSVDKTAGQVSGFAVVRFTLSDTAADPVTLIGFEYSLLGDFTDAVDVGVETGEGAPFPSGATEDLRTTEVGLPYSVTWSSADTAPYSAPSARIRLRVGDVYELESQWAESPAFVLANTRDTLPPASVENLVVQRNTDTEVELSWKNPEDDFAGVFILRRDGAAMTGSERPTDGTSYFVGGTVNGIPIQAITTNSRYIDTGVVAGAYDYQLFVFDAALNYSPGRRPPWTSATSMLWCPDETGTFSVSSPDATGQQLWWAPVAGLSYALGTLYPASTPTPGVPAPVPPGSDWALDVTYYARTVAVGPGGRRLSQEQEIWLSPGTLPATSQPVPSGSSQEATFVLEPLGWSDFEAQFDSSPHPSEDWSDATWLLRGPNALEVTANFPLGGEYYMRARATRPGCSTPGPWTVSDLISTADVYYMLEGATGDGSSPGTPSDMPPPMVDLTTPLTIYVGAGTLTVSPGWVIGWGVSFRGGYSPDFSVYEPETYTSTLTGSVDGPLLDLGINGTSPKLNDLTVINAYASANSVGVLVQGGNPLTTDCIISGEWAGVEIDGGGTVLRANDISGGALAESAAVVVTNTTFSWMIWSTLSGGTGATTTRGVHVAGTNTGTVRIEASHIDAGTGSTAYGVEIANAASGSLVANNTIRTGSEGATAVGISASDKTVITNNTIQTVCGSTGNATGIDNGGSGTVVANNIVFNDCAGTSICISDTPPGIGSLQNNLVFSCPSALLADVTNFMVVCPNGNFAESAPCTNPLSGPLSVDNQTVASLPTVGFAGATDFHLTASTPTSITAGGLNTSQSVCGSAADETCGFITEDIEKTPRTCPAAGSDCYSIGAYEYD